MKTKILLTRPRAASERLAALLSQRGFDSVVEPLITIEPALTPRPAGLFQAVLITSANALDAAEKSNQRLADLFPLPCFCVGTATGAAARAAGFTDIRCGTADGAALARMVIKSLRDKILPVLRLTSETADATAQNILSENGFALRSWGLYRATAVEDFSPAAKDALARGDIDAIPVFSPRSAQILVSMIEKKGLSEACRKVTAIGLSQAVSDVLQTLPWRRLRTALRPEEEEVLTCLQSEFSMTEPEFSPSQPQARCSKARRFVWGILLVALFVGAIAMMGDWWTRQPAPTPVTQNAPELASLNRRLDSLESRLDARSEPTAMPADTTGLSEEVKNLEAQLAQDETKINQQEQKTQKLIAATVAFWDLRAAVQEGRSFAPQLAALRTTSSGDAALDEQLARLEPFALSAMPNLPQLREMLISEETPVSIVSDASASWVVRIKAALQPLVSVHPLHNSAYAGVEKALEAGDASVALEAVKALPDEAQKNLAAWQAKLEARIAIDTTLQALAARFSTPSVGQGGAP
jgi:uroporphyrinogen-III synthase